MRFDFIGAFRVKSDVEFDSLTLALDSFVANTPKWGVNRFLLIDDVSDYKYFKGYDFPDRAVEIPNSCHLGDVASYKKAAQLIPECERGDGLFLLDLGVYFTAGWLEPIEWAFTSADDSCKLTVSNYGWLVGWNLWEKVLLNG